MVSLRHVALRSALEGLRGLASCVGCWRRARLAASVHLMG